MSIHTHTCVHAIIEAGKDNQRKKKKIHTKHYGLIKIGKYENRIGLQNSYSAAQLSPSQNIYVICISPSLFHSHKNNAFCLTNNASYKETDGNG